MRRSIMTVPRNACTHLFVTGPRGCNVCNPRCANTKRLCMPGFTATSAANQKGKHRKRSPRLKTTSERNCLDELERRRVEKRGGTKSRNRSLFAFRFSSKRGAFHDEGGILTCRSLPFAAFPFLAEQWRRLRKTRCLQWRDRAGFTPASLLSAVDFSKTSKHFYRTTTMTSRRFHEAHDRQMECKAVYIHRLVRLQWQLQNTPIDGLFWRKSINSRFCLMYSVIRSRSIEGLATSWSAVSLCSVSA